MKRQTLALDIGDDSVTAVVVRHSGQDRRVVACASVELRSREDLDPALAELVGQVPVGDGVCVCGVSLDGVSLRNLRIPFTDRRRIDQVLPLELEDQLPVPVADQVVDYLVTGSGEGGSTLLVACLEKERLGRDLDSLRRAGLRPRLVTLRDLVLASSLLRDPSMPDDFLLLDIGRFSSSILFVHRRRAVFFRRLAISPFLPVATADAGTLTGSDRDAGLTRDLCAEIMRSIGLFTISSGTDFQPERVMVGGAPSADPQLVRRISTELAMEALPCDSVETARMQVDTRVQETYQPARMAHALALVRNGGRGRQVVNFLKGEFAPASLLLVSGPQRLAAVAVAVILLVGVLSWLGLGYRGLRDRYDRLGTEMTTMYRETFPGATRIVDPLVQMKANVRDVQAPSIASPLFSGEKRVLNILADISARVPESVRIQVARMVIDQESVQMKGMTDTFNNVNLIQSGLRKSPRFADVAIVSAAADKESGMIRFELRLQLREGA